MLSILIRDERSYFAKLAKAVTTVTAKIECKLDPAPRKTTGYCQWIGYSEPLNLKVAQEVSKGELN
jgi:hypothetical protein